MFDRELQKKLLFDIIADEEKRVISNKLANESGIRKIVSMAAEKSEDDLDSLKSILSLLSEIQLPGDFERVVGKDPGVIVIELEGEEPEEDEECEIKLVEEASKEIKFLEKLAYDFGKDGAHEEAYMVERAVKKIKNCEG